MKSSDLKRKLAIVYALGAISVVVLVVVGLIIVNGTKEERPSSAERTEQAGAAAGDDRDSGSPPALRTVAVERGEGMDAAVSASSPSIERPGQIWLRVSAAPKQEVSGTWNVSCGSGNVADDTFTVTPPHLMRLEVPDENASCIAAAAAQLDGEGRLKLAILRER
jgi:hypothetical protein